MTYQKDDRAVRMVDFDAIQVGDETELSHLLTKEDVQLFASLTGDFNPLHTDEEFAKKTLFQKPVVHGMLSASFISTMIGMFLPGGGALWMSQTLEFINPAHVGDIIRVVAGVKQKSLATRVLVLQVVVTNQLGKELIRGQSTVKVLEVKNEEKSMDHNVKGAVLITGGSRGIGAATAHKLAADGFPVVINYLSAEEGAQRVVNQIIQEGGRAIALKADVASLEQVKKLFISAEETFGPIQSVVHCAAPGNVPQPFNKLDWDAFQSQIDIHLKGAFNCAKCALPKMVEAKFGSMVFIGTVYTEGVPPVQQARYVVAKAALTSLARCLAAEYGPMNIRVNVVAPGMTQTEMIADLPDKVKMLTKMQTPLRRLAEPEDIAHTIAFLLNPASRHITGQTIAVCGGAVML
jgi:3-oxoacyl-[acyl-carrier protein] reductase